MVAGYIDDRDETSVSIDGYFVDVFRVTAVTTLTCRPGIWRRQPLTKLLLQVAFMIPPIFLISNLHFFVVRATMGDF